MGFVLQLAVHPLLEGLGQGGDLAQYFHRVWALVDDFHGRAVFGLFSFCNGLMSVTD